MSLGAMHQTRREREKKAPQRLHSSLSAKIRHISSNIAKTVRHVPTKIKWVALVICCSPWTNQEWRMLRKVVKHWKQWKNKQTSQKVNEHDDLKLSTCIMLW